MRTVHAQGLRFSLEDPSISHNARRVQLQQENKPGRGTQLVQSRDMRQISETFHSFLFNVCSEDEGGIKLLKSPQWSTVVHSPHLDRLVLYISSVSSYDVLYLAT